MGIGIRLHESSIRRYGTYHGPGLSVLNRIITVEPYTVISFHYVTIEKHWYTSNTNNIAARRINVVSRAGSALDNIKCVAVQTVKFHK